MSNIIDAILHHPIHPVIVHFPIGLTGAAAFFMLLALIWKRSKILEQIAFANISLAAVATVVAGITGYLDNINRYGGSAANHQYKIVLAITLFLITSGTAILRWKKPDIFEQKTTQWIYAGAYAVSFAIALTLGFLGGIIVWGE
jgi:uncharacterized membrane protein